MMAEQKKVSGIRGVKDVLPGEVEHWQWVEETSRRVLHRYGYSEIKIPIFERTELFARGIGETTDIVEKEMYTFTDKGGESITLRPEATASIIRAYIEHHLYKGSPLSRLYAIGPMFRYERPQAGRLRQFYQIDAEAIGSLSPSIDAELILMVWELLHELGLKGLSLELNSLGDRESRASFREALKLYFEQKLDLLCENCRRRFHTNPLRILDCKEPGCIEGVYRGPS
ncbi:MAG: histidine--tRNA ligase, partial [Nitrospinota bacterium]